MTFLLHHTVEQSAQKYPDHIAYRFDEQSLTYAELNGRTNSLAHLLHELGVRKGDRVGIHLHQSMEIAIAIYGILKAGAVFVPLDPSLPINRLQFVIADCGIEHVISQNRKLAGLQQVAEKIDQIKSVIGVTAVEPHPPFKTISWEEVYRRPSAKAPAVTGLIDQDLAYIMYTSGSTGTPKGLMHTHYSGLSYAQASAALYEVTPDDVISGHAPIHFDISTFAMFASPLAGATAVIIPEEYKMLPASLSELIQDEGITIWYSVTTAIVELILRGALEHRDLSALRWIKFGGEPFPPKHMQTLQEMLPHARVCNVYGPAEVNQCTYFHVPDLPHKYKEIYVPIGYVWDVADGLIVDENDEAVPVGQTGELLIAASTRMQGYWKQPELTERGFYRQRPYPDTPYEKIFYRTGDLVRLDEDGLLHFLGRKDRQLKIRGYRVELDEIEAALTAHTAVAEAAAYPMRDPNNNQVIEAAVVLKKGAEASADELIRHGTAHLPAYAVPQTILLYETFPRTGSGKINRRALQELSRENS